MAWGETPAVDAVIPVGTAPGCDRPARVGVTVNGRALGRRVTGVERYAREVVARLPDGVVVVSGGPERSGWRGHLWEQSRLPRRIPRGDLLWSPANTGPLAVREQVVTVHDVAPLDHPEWFDPVFGAWYRWMLPRLARRVRRVVTDSEFSKGRILARTGLAEERVAVVHPGVDHEFFRPAGLAEIEAVRESYRLPDRYVLAVGTLDPRKGLEDLVAAWRRVRSAEGVLAIAGGRVPTLRRSLRIEEDDTVRLLGYVPDQRLRPLYAGAAAFALPSHYEGFGLTVLEALACGAPVVASNGAALPEVAGSAAVYVPPGDRDALAEALRGVLGDASVAGRLREEGLARAARFGWDRTARGVWDVLSSARTG